MIHVIWRRWFGTQFECYLWNLSFTFLGPWSFPDSSVDKESACNAGDPSLIPGSGISTGEAISYPPQYSWASLWLIHLQCRRPGFDPWIGKSPWRRERLPNPVFWPGDFHGLDSPWDHKELECHLLQKKD